MQMPLVVGQTLTSGPNPRYTAVRNTSHCTRFSEQGRDRFRQPGVAGRVGVHEVGLEAVVGEDLLEHALLVGDGELLRDNRVEIGRRRQQAGLGNGDQHDLRAPRLREAHHRAQVARRLRLVELLQEVVAALAEDDELRLRLLERRGQAREARRAGLAGNTRGHDLASDQRLEALIGRKVVSSGVPGETSAAGLARLPAALEEAKPQLVILCEGGNDFLQKLDEAQAASNLRAMVRLAQSRGAQVVLIAVPKPGLLPSPADFYAVIAKELAVPNAAGYARLAEAVAALLRKTGAV